MRWSQRQAANVIQQGGVIAYPTEAVYGLGCHPLDEAAVHHLLQLKQRDPGKGLILISDNLNRLEPFLKPLTQSDRKQLNQTWPGAVTWLIPAQDWVPLWLTGWHSKLAVRVTAHPIAAGLCREAGMPIVSTSANISGHHPARNKLQVLQQFGNQLDAIVSGQSNLKAKPSTIRDLKTQKIIRPG